MTSSPLAIAAAERAGFAPQNLLPILPITAKPGATVMLSEPDALGKAPFYWNAHAGPNGLWCGLGSWRTGSTKEQRDTSDAAGANCGLLLGNRASGQSFVAIDVDTDFDPKDAAGEKRAIAICRAVLTIAAVNFAAPVWFRTTKPGRIALLVRVDSGPAGVKRKIKIAEQDGTSLGQIEILAEGQQVVIGGVHRAKGGTPIRWVRTDLGQREAMPVVAELPVAPTLEHLTTFIGLIIHALKDIGVEVAGLSAAPSSAADPLTAAEAAPPSVDLLVALLDAMKNPAHADRTIYVNVMRAVSACQRALHALGQLLGDASTRIGEAVAGWASSWEGPNPKSLEDEIEEWTRDYERNPADHMGWPFLVSTAFSLGIRDVRVWQDVMLHVTEAANRRAQDEFEAEEEPTATVPFGVASESRVIATVGRCSSLPRQRRPGLVDIPTSQIQITDSVQEIVGNISVWLSAEKRWLVWYGVEAGWASPLADRFLRMWVADALMHYVGMHGSEWTETTRAKLTGAACIGSVETLLRDRLACEMSGINRGREVVQVPGAAYCLRTGRRLSVTEQMGIRETRSLSVAPDPAVAMPLFDELVLHLACGDEEVAAWLWAYMGYLLLGNPVAHVLLVIHGPGGNGKGTLGRVLTELFGSYGRTIARDVVTEAGAKKHETSLYATRGKRLWYIDELDKASKWNEAQIRAMTGGSEINARGMNMDDQTFKAEGSFLITTNFIPAFYRIDDAITRRFRIIHSRLKPERSNPQLDKDILANEAPGIVARLIREAKAFLQRGMELPDVPAAMQTSANRFFAEQDQFYGWFKQECEVGGGLEAQVGVDTMRGRYDAYVKRQNADNAETDETGMLDVMSPAAFLTALRRVGVLLDGTDGRRLVRQRDGKSQPYCAGVRLKLSAVA